MFVLTPLLKANYKSQSKIIVNQGGTSAGKSFSILQTLILKAIERKCLITIVGQDHPNLKKGVIRDLKNIISDNNWIERLLKGDSYNNAWNISNSILTFKNGSQIEFNSYENEQDARGGRRDYLFINEANGINYNIFWQLFIRTALQTYIDYNPSASFWAHEKVLIRNDSELIISDHRINPFISEALHNEIENIEDAEMFKVYARGLTGKVTGLIFQNWRMCNEFPAQCKKIIHGMDFGYSNSYTTLIKCGVYEGEIYLHELLFERGQQNEDIDRHLSNLINKSELIICDSNEPKTADWLQGRGYHIRKTKKGGSISPNVNYGISLMKSYRINITSDSQNLKKEFERYSWKVDKDGNTLNEPVKMFDHGIDAARYGLTELLAENRQFGYF
jgi:phage terminase large subunit